MVDATPKQSRPLVKTKTFWGAILAAIPAVSETLEHAVGSGFLPPQVVPIVAGAGLLLTLLGRLTADTEVTGIFK